MSADFVLTNEDKIEMLEGILHDAERTRYGLTIGLPGGTGDTIGAYRSYDKDGNLIAEVTESEAKATALAAAEERVATLQAELTKLRGTS